MSSYTAALRRYYLLMPPFHYVTFYRHDASAVSVVLFHIAAIHLYTSARDTTTNEIYAISLFHYYASTNEHATRSRRLFSPWQI